MTTDSRRPNADIDPTVFIDDDGTPWLAWGNGDCYLVKLKPNMIEMDGPIKKLDITSQYSEGPWLYKRGKLYYNVFAVDVPGMQPKQIGYATAPAVEGPWTYHGLVTTRAKVGFTIHPAVVEFKGQWYFFYHDGSTALDGQTGGDCRRSVCVEYLDYNSDGTIKPILPSKEGVAAPGAKPGPSKVTLLLGAENGEAACGRLHGTQVARDRPGFTGTGYVLGFDKPYRGVTVMAQQCRPSRYRLKIRYAAPDADQRNKILVNYTSIDEPGTFHTEWSKLIKSQYMANNKRPPASLILIFGGSVALNYRKLSPALYNLFIDG